MGMNPKPPDRWPPDVWRARAETIGQMHAQGWLVQSCCPKCDLVMEVSLPDMIKLRGPDFSLWSRRPTCRRLACGGKVKFLGKPPPLSRFLNLDAEWTGRLPPRGK